MQEFDQPQQSTIPQIDEKYDHLRSKTHFLRSESGLDLFLYQSQQKDQICNIQEYKTMIVIGETGSGKTTLINFFLNYHFGVSFEEKVRFLLINEETVSGSQATSQTQNVNIYYVEPANGNPGIRIVDTPGFGDTRGIGQDKVIAEKIQKCFKYDVETVTTICFIVKASNVRLTGSQNYILSCITQMFGKDIIENFIFMLTFCDGKAPKAKDALLFQGDNQNYASHVANLIPQIKEPWFLKLNSSAFLSENQGEEDDIKMTNMFWKIAMTSFESYSEKKLKLNKDASLVLTREVIKQRETIINVINNLRPKISQCLNLIETIQTIYDTISQMESQMIDTQNYIIKTNKCRIEKINLPNGQYVTNCVVCNNTCHFPCRYANDNDKQKCTAISEENCTVCQKKCHWTQHSNMGFRFESIEYTENVELAELKNKYIQSKSKKTQKQQILRGIQAEYFEKQLDCFNMQKELKDCVNKLRQIALQPAVCQSQEEYIDIMVQEEMNSKRPGWQQRINALQDQKSKWKLIRETTENTGDVKKAEDFKQLLAGKNKNNKEFYERLSQIPIQKGNSFLKKMKQILK